MFVELHMIQNFAPSCLNRDDTNSPKDSVFGGFRRARISSQCLKRSIRHHPVFAETVRAAIGVRTLLLVDTVAARLAEAGKDVEDARTVAKAVISHTYSKLDGEQTAVALYLGENELARLEAALLERWEAVLADAREAPPEPEGGKKKGKKAKSSAEALNALVSEFKGFTREAAKAPDIALFGRMIAEAKELGVDAACQVAHALSTHRVAMEMDFFTAVDDLQPDDDPSAAMMGTVEFNSSCFYRYALVDTDQLTANLGGDPALARATVEGFLRAAVAAIPTGKQNSMAAQNRPSLVLGVVRDGGCPASLANAFEEPVRVREHGAGLVTQSVTALLRHWDQLAAAYGQEGLRAAALLSLKEPEGGDFGSLAGARVASFEDFVAAVCAALPEGA